MPRDGSGQYNLPTGNPVVNGTVISDTTHNSTMSDVASALSASLVSDGQKVATGDQPMGGNKHTNVGVAAARNQYAAVSQVQDASFITLGSVSGADTITGSLNPAITSYATRMAVIFTPASNNTGPATIAINGLAAKSIVKGNAEALVAADLVAGVPAKLLYDGTKFLLLNPLATLPAASGANLTALNASNLASGTIPDGRFPATLPAASGANLTALNASNLASGTILDARVSSGNVTQHQAALSIATTQLTGNMPDGRIVASNVTQHQAALSIAESQITDGSILARVGANETISGTYNFSARPKTTSQGGFLSYADPSNSGGSITISTSDPSGTPGEGDQWLKREA